MNERKVVSYKEISFDGLVTDRDYKNPMTNVFQYEYALYLVMAGLFHSARSNSQCLGSLGLYFRELPRGAKEEENPDTKEQHKRSQRKLLEEMERLVAKDVIGQIDFPMPGICAVEVITHKEEDGTHRFIFTDGIYRFSVHLDMERKGHPRGIEVRNMRSTL